MNVYHQMHLPRRSDVSDLKADEIRSSRREYATPEQWDHYRDTITALYSKENKPLDQVISEMQQQHGFRGTRRQYQLRLSSWGLDKRNKAFEMAAIHRKMQERGMLSKKSAFRLRGKPLDLDDFRRYMNRKLRQDPEFLAKHSDQGTPPDVEVWTPPPPVSNLHDTCHISELEESPPSLSEGSTLTDEAKSNTNIMEDSERVIGRSLPKPSENDRLEMLQSHDLPHVDAAGNMIPTSLKAAETALVKFIADAFISDTWIIDADGDCKSSVTHEAKFCDPLTFKLLVSTATAFFMVGEAVTAGELLDRAFGMVRSMLQTHDPRTIPAILDTIWYLEDTGLRQIASMLVEYVADMSMIIFRALSLWSCLRKLDTQLGSLELESLQNGMIATLDGFLSSRSVFKNELELDMYARMYLDEDFMICPTSLIAVELHLQSKLHEYEGWYGRYHPIYLYALKLLAYNHLDQEKFSEAESIARQLIAHASVTGSAASKVEGLRLIAKSTSSLARTRWRMRISCKLWSWWERLGS